MTPLAWTYLVYLAITTGLTAWVARTLRQSGSILAANQSVPSEVTQALTHLLIVGFYLVNFGVISFWMKSSPQVVDAQTAIELLSTKVGSILVVLGGMHFFMLLLFLGARENSKPVAPSSGYPSSIAELHRLRAESEQHESQ